MICSHSWMTRLSEKPAADWSPRVGQCLLIQSTWPNNVGLSSVIRITPAKRDLGNLPVDEPGEDQFTENRTLQAQHEIASRSAR
jgi:hypothetical protein